MSLLRSHITYDLNNFVGEVGFGNMTLIKNKSLIVILCKIERMNVFTHYNVSSIKKNPFASNILGNTLVHRSKHNLN